MFSYSPTWTEVVVPLDDGDGAMAIMYRERWELSSTDWTLEVKGVLRENEPKVVTVLTKATAG